jgi:alkanesulfonate monooxygenase SsuD/methylene tetrahydromethanopterin reductase-like flavin-dependent oxidoreductase (luciferase family)
MKFSLLTVCEFPESKTQSQVFREIIEMAEYAEELGFDRIWLAEHHVQRYGICTNIPVLGAAVAARTSRLRIGSGICLVPFRDAFSIAEDFAMLDAISDGRLDFGVGRGYHKYEFDHLGLDINGSRQAFYEGMDVIEEAWRTGVTSGVSGSRHYDRAELVPMPVQSPPPIWMAANSPESFAHAAERGYKLLSAQLTPWSDLVAGHDNYVDLWTQEGRDPAAIEIALGRHVFVDRDGERARRTPEAGVRWLYSALGRGVAPGVDDTGHVAVKGYEAHERSWQSFQGEIDYEGALRNTYLYGEPREVVERIGRLEESLHLTELICVMDAGDIETGLVRNSMELFAAEVIPQFKGATATSGASV